MNKYTFFFKAISIILIILQLMFKSFTHSLLFLVIFEYLCLVQDLSELLTLDLSLNYLTIFISSHDLNLEFISIWGSGVHALSKNLSSQY